MSISSISKRLAGKTVFITGASSGIGKATAREFARTAPTDLRLILTARRVDRLEELKAAIAAEVGPGVKVLAAKLDVTSASEVNAFVDGLAPEWREIDILVNNAGLVKGVDEAPEIDTEDIQVMVDTNILGLLHVTQAVLKIFKARPNGGKGDVINLGSIAGRAGYKGGAIYCGTKAFVRSFSETLRKETINSQIRVMELQPGAVETEFSVVRFRGDAAKAAAVYAGAEPLTPEDVAETIVYMAGRRDNVVVAEVLLFPSYQASATDVYKKPQ